MPNESQSVSYNLLTIVTRFDLCVEGSAELALTRKGKVKALQVSRVSLSRKRERTSLENANRMPVSTSDFGLE